MQPQDPSPFCLANLTAIPQAFLALAQGPAVKPRPAMALPPLAVLLVVQGMHK